MSRFGILTIWDRFDLGQPEIKRVVEFRIVPGTNGANVQLRINGERIATGRHAGYMELAMARMLLNWGAVPEPDVYADLDPLAWAIRALKGRGIMLELVS